MTGTPPAVPAFAAGYGYSPAQMDALVQTPFTFLTTNVVLRAQLQGAKALTAATFTVLNFGNTGGDIIEDPYGGWSTSATATQAAFSWLCPTGCSGWYEATMTTVTAGSGTSASHMINALYLDGADYQQAAAVWPAESHNAGVCSAVPVFLIGGADYVQFYVLSTIGLNTSTTAGQLCTLEICWISS
jgi:hypothetical protein